MELRKIDLVSLEGRADCETLYWENWHILTKENKEYYIANICSLFNGVDFCAGDSLIDIIYENYDRDSINIIIKKPKSFIRKHFGLSLKVTNEIYSLYAKYIDEEL